MDAAQDQSRESVCRWRQLQFVTGVWIAGMEDRADGLAIDTTRLRQPRKGGAGAALVDKTLTGDM
jgi:hypothetical protein